jgi:hypothetical protein
MDRERAAANLKSALVAASIAVGMFGLAFFAAILYIG